MTGKRGHPIGKAVIVGHRGSRITISSKVLSGIKRKGAYVPKCPNSPAFVLSHVRLSTIFNYPKFMLSSDCHDRVHVGRLTIKMDWDDTDSCRCDLCFDQCRVDRE